MVAGQHFGELALVCEGVRRVGAVTRGDYGPAAAAVTAAADRRAWPPRLAAGALCQGGRDGKVDLSRPLSRQLRVIPLCRAVRAAGLRRVGADLPVRGRGAGPREAHVVRRPRGTRSIWPAAGSVNVDRTRAHVLFHGVWHALHGQRGCCAKGEQEPGTVELARLPHRHNDAHRIFIPRTSQPHSMIRGRAHTRAHACTATRAAPPWCSTDAQRGCARTVQWTVHWAAEDPVAATARQR